MRTKTIVATNGRVVDISQHVNKMMLIINSGDYGEPEDIEFFRKFGSQLIIVAGPDAPGKIINEYEKHMGKRRAAFLREIWEPLASDYREGWSHPMKARR